MSGSAFEAHLRDQIGAAEREAADLFHLLEWEAGQTSISGPPSEWLDRLVRAAFAGGDCGHLGSPAPVFIAAWGPPMTRCRQCFAEAQRHLRGTPEDRRCDVCGAVLATTIYPFAVRGGAVTVSGGACAWCRPIVDEHWKG